MFPSGDSLLPVLQGRHTGLGMLTEGGGNVLGNDPKADRKLPYMDQTCSRVVASVFQSRNRRLLNFPVRKYPIRLSALEDKSPGR